MRIIEHSASAPFVWRTATWTLETRENFSPRNSILPMYFRSYGTKPLEEDSFLSYNQPRTCAQGRARKLPRQELSPFFSLFPLSLSRPTFPLFRVFFFPPCILLFLPLSARREIRDMHCFLQEKQWSCFCANHDVDRRESAPQLVYDGSHLKAKQMFSQSQPLWRSTRFLPRPPHTPPHREKLERTENSFIR